jgi:CheY-like chemotaxis protein
VADTIYSKKETSIGRIQRAADSGNDRANILIVDDRPDKLMALEATLASLGQNLILAHSGTEAGEITLRSSNPQTKWIRLEVIDNGIGIPPCALPRIFDPFEQVSGVGSGGLGLGLTICKAIVEVQLFLERSGYLATTAGTVNAALRIAEEQKFDLLISDIGLPDGEGHDLVRQMRERGHKSKSIALSAYSTEQDITRSHAAGFQAHLVKPVLPQDLLAAIKRLLGPGPASPFNDLLAILPLQ